jgi:hypothetical protein
VITNLVTEDGPLRSETRLRYYSIKCIKIVGNKHILSSYAQHGMKGIKIVPLHATEAHGGEEYSSYSFSTSDTRWR